MIRHRVNLRAALKSPACSTALVSLLLSLKETGCYISYLAVNIFFYKKLEVECVVVINGDEHVFGVGLVGFFFWSGLTDLSYLSKHQNGNMENECASFIRNYCGPPYCFGVI